MKKVNFNTKLKGPAYEININDQEFPISLKSIEERPDKLYVVGNINALREGIAIVGARKASPYGLSCTKYFANIAANMGITIVSGGAYGCDSAAHRAALDAKCKTVVFMGSGLNVVYPYQNQKMFQNIIDAGGAIVSENDWEYLPLKHTFLNRNRLIAALAKVTLIIEAGIKSGTFSTADWAIKYNKEVWAVPGAITNKNSSGCNQLIYDGAKPIINDQVFIESISYLFNNSSLHKSSSVELSDIDEPLQKNYLIKAIMSQPMRSEDLYEIACRYCKGKNPSVWMSQILLEAEAKKLISKQSDGYYCALMRQ